jgi:hypothetical protein
MTSESSMPSMNRPCRIGLPVRDQALGNVALEACGLDATMYTTLQECMEQATCKGGSLYLDGQASRFVADLSHTPSSTHLLVQPYHLNSFSKSFDTHFDGDWEQALKGCHFWMWTKYAKFNPEHASCQSPGQVPEGIINVVRPIIMAMGKGMWFRHVPSVQRLLSHEDLADMSLNQALMWLKEKERQDHPTHTLSIQPK